MKEDHAAAKTKQARGSNDSTATLPQVERRNGQACDDDEEGSSAASPPLGPGVLDEEAALWEHLDSLHTTTASNVSPPATVRRRLTLVGRGGEWAHRCEGGSEQQQQ